MPVRSIDEDAIAVDRAVDAAAELVVLVGEHKSRSQMLLRADEIPQRQYHTGDDHDPGHDHPDFPQPHGACA
jgi:hypothetical protein